MSKVLDLLDEIEKGEEPQKFTAVVSNPPYQMETSPTTSQPIYQEFQRIASLISYYTSLIYPGEKWLKKTGQAVLKNFAQELMNKKSLHKVKFYEDFKELFPTSVDPEGGIAIVFTNEHVKNDDYWYFEVNSKGRKVIRKQALPGDEAIDTSLDFISILEKTKSSKTLAQRYHKVGTFGIESSFIEKNKENFAIYEDNPNEEGFIRIITNDVSGVNGRTKSFWIEKKNLPKQSFLLERFKVVISSRHTSGADGRSQNAEVLAPNEAFGGTRICVGDFDTLEESVHYKTYITSKLVKKLLQSSTKRLTNFGINAPDLEDYTDSNPHIDWSQPLDPQLYKLFELTEEEIKTVEDEKV